MTLRDKCHVKPGTTVVFKGLTAIFLLAWLYCFLVINLTSRRRGKRDVDKQIYMGEKSKFSKS